MPSPMKTMRTEAVLDPSEIILPNIKPGSRLHGGGVMTDALMAAVPPDTKAIVFFGSAVRKRKTLSGTGRCLFHTWRWTARGCHDANDVDVLAMVDGESSHGKAFEGNILMPFYGDYGGFFGMSRRGRIHVACLQESEFQSALAGGSTSAASVVREGIIFAGETSVRLERRQTFRKIDGRYKRVPMGA